MLPDALPAIAEMQAAAHYSRIARETEMLHGTLIGVIGFGLCLPVVAAGAITASPSGPHRLALGDWPMKLFNFCEGKADGNYCGDGRLDPRLSLTCSHGKPIAATPCVAGCDMDRGVCKTVSSSLTTNFTLRPSLGDASTFPQH